MDELENTESLAAAGIQTPDPSARNLVFYTYYTIVVHLKQTKESKMLVVTFINNVFCL
jgi:hypothetical protein